jgi:hypothetical protein
MKYSFSLNPPAAAQRPPQFSRDELARVYPYVVSKSWVEHVGASSLLAREFSDDVRVVLVIDDNDTMRTVRPQDLESVGETRESAFDIAGRNLIAAYDRQAFELGFATLADGVQVGCARGSWLAPAGGLMLGSLYEAMKTHFGGEEFAAIAVNQQYLLAFPADPKTLASAALRKAVEEGFRHEKPISRAWLVLDGQWPRAYPREQAF